MKGLLVLLWVVTFIGGCAPFIPVVKVDELPADQRVAIEDMANYTAEDLAKLRYTRIAEIEGFSCKDLLWSPGATPEDAVNQVKYWAHKKGANAITNLKCESKEGVSFGKNCWESIRCTAEAIRVEK